MNPRVQQVIPDKDYKLLLTFTNGEVRLFDMHPYLEKGLFRELIDESMFNTVKPVCGSIQWHNGLDLCPDTLYEDSFPV